MQTKNNRNRLVSTLIELINADEAIDCLLHISSNETYDRKEFERTQARIVSNNELRRAINSYKVHLEKRIDDVGLRIDIAPLSKLRDKIAEFSEKADYALVPKYILDKIFKDYGSYISDYESLPDHTQFAIHLGKFRTEQGKFEVFLLEQILHEDVCSLFNLAATHHAKDTPTSNKYSIKTKNSLCRACIVASFNFVECYLNAIAFNHALHNKGKLSEKDRDLLLEYDSKLERVRYVSLREKLLKYPRIILSLEHPPVSESNNPDVKTFLNYAKTIRDSIVHTKPFHEDLNVNADEAALHGINMTDVELVVDASIRIVKTIESLVNPQSVRLRWLMERGANGSFAEEAFE